MDDDGNGINVRDPAAPWNEGLEIPHEAPVAYAEEEEELGDELQFDITLPATHSYMGSGLETLGGRQVLEAGWTGRVPGVPHHGVVFPGETVPMLLPDDHGDVILKDRLFVLLCPEFDAMKRRLRPTQFFALCRNVVVPRADRTDRSDVTDHDLL